MRLPLALAFFLSVAPLNAAPINPTNISVGNTVICDTPDQAKRFVALRSGGSEAIQALQLINKEAANPSACGAAMVAFRPGEANDIGRLDGKPVQVVKVTVLAYNTGAGWSFVPDTVQYAVIIPDGIEI